MKLSTTQRIMLRCSAVHWDASRAMGSDVTLRNAANHRTARSLEALGLGTVVEGRPGVFYANEAGRAQITPPGERTE